MIFGAIGQEIDNPLLTEAGWGELLRRHGFGGVESLLQIAENPSFGFISANSTPSIEPALPADILIVEGDSPSVPAKALSEGLSQCLQIFGFSSSTVTLDETLSMDLAGKACVVLAEIENPLLFGIGAEEFNSIKRLILESSSVTWVTRGGAVDCSEPRLSLITGLSRTIRSENPGLALSTLDLDPNSPLDSIANAKFIFKAIRCHSRTGGDSEFAVRGNRMMIPRVTLSKDVNNLVGTQNMEPVPEPALLKEPGRALTLTIGVPGMLDTLHFTEDEKHVLPLKPDDVEIEVKASGL